MSLNPQNMQQDPCSTDRTWREPSAPVRYILLGIGSAAVVMGVVGIFLPMWPTTPFLLLATACYVRASKRLHVWLVTHPRLGCYVQDYISGRGMPRRSKITALSMLWLTLTTSFVLAALRFPSTQLAIVYIVSLSAIGAWVHWYIGYKIPTRAND